MFHKLAALATMRQTNVTIQPSSGNAVGPQRTMRQRDFAKLLPDCCRIGFAAIDQYDVEERSALRTFLPGVRTVIVVAHHVMHALEWTWFPFNGDSQGPTCLADLHATSMSERITQRLAGDEYESVLLPYPGACGVMFKTLAVRTGLGQLGDSFLFMNADWGPWIHLRVILTDAPVQFVPPVPDEACTHCGVCRQTCPSGAILEDDFDGMRCKEHMRGVRNMLGKSPTVYECEQCLRACPIGQPPREVLVSYAYQTL